METKRSIDGNWVIESGVPIFRPHVRRDKKGKELYRVTDSDLYAIAKASNTVDERMHGDKPPQSLGHRKFQPDVDEQDQPEIVGYETNFRVKTLPDGKNVLVCDRFTQANRWEECKSYPYCSAEYHPGMKKIIGLARLRVPPELNLGGIFYPKSNEQVFVYSYSGETTMNDEQMNDDGIGQMNDDDHGLDEAQQKVAEQVYRYMCKKYSWMGAAAKKYEADMGGSTTPIGSGSAMPSTGSQPPNDEMQQYSAIMAEAKYERNLAKTDRALLELEAENYEFDRSAERGLMVSMDDEGRAARVQNIKKFHRKRDGRVQIYSGTVESDIAHTGGISQEDMSAVMSYAAEHELSYPVALERYMNAKKDSSGGLFGKKRT